MRITSHKYFYPLVLTLIFIGTYSYTFDAKVAQLGDNASYYMLGKALSQGDGYVNISKITKTPNNHYPPGYPTFLAIGMLFTDGFVGLKVLNGIALLISIWVMYFLSYRITESKIMGVLVGAAMLLNYHLLQYGSMLMSEIPFLCFSLLALWFTVNIKNLSVPLPDRNFWLALAFGVVAYYTRSLGLGLIVATAVFFGTDKRWKTLAIYVGGFILAALPWFIRSQQLGGGSYTRQLQRINPYRPELGTAGLSDYIDRIGENFTRYITTEIPYSLFPGGMPDYQSSPEGSDWVLGVLLCSIIILGLWKIPRFRFLFLGYPILTFGILMLWPNVWVGPRFMIPLIPILYLGLFHGVYFVLNQIATRANKSFRAAWLFPILLFMFPSVSTLHESAKLPLHPAWQNYYTMGLWIRQNIESDAVVSCGKPALFHLYSSTYTSRFAFENDTNEFLRKLEEDQVDYVVLDQVYGNSYRYLLPAIQSHPERFQQVHSVKNPDTYLFKFVK